MHDIPTLGVRAWDRSQMRDSWQVCVFGQLALWV